MTLRIADLSQAGLIVDFVNQAFRARYFHGGHAIDVNQFASLSKKGKFLLAERGGELAGCVYVAPKVVGASLLELLVVNPQMRRTGIGSQLIEAAESLCRSMKSSYMHVHVANLNYEIVRFCQHRGYIEFDQLPCQCDSQSVLDCYTLKMMKHLDWGSPGF